MHLAALHTPSQIQLNQNGNLKHFLTIEGLSKETLTKILDTAQSFFNDQNQLITNNLLEGRTVMNLFFENSTRTRTTFEAAAKRLSANVLNIDIARSSTSKGETLRDTLWNLEAMAADIFVVRHSSSGAAHFIAKDVCPNIAIINAGDGRHAHPTQAMLDMLTIRRETKKKFEDISIAIISEKLGISSDDAKKRLEEGEKIAQGLRLNGTPQTLVYQISDRKPVGAIAGANYKEFEVYLKTKEEKK